MQVAFITPSVSAGGKFDDTSRKKNPSFKIFEFDSALEVLETVK